MENLEHGEDGDQEIPSVKLMISNSAFGRRVRQFELQNIGHKHIDLFLLDAFKLYEQEINEALSVFDVIKSISYFSADFEKIIERSDQNEPLLEKRTVHIPTKMAEIYLNTDLRKLFRYNIIEYIIKRVEDVMIEGSGFKLSRINQLSTQIFQYQPLKASGFIELPKQLKNKRAIINLKNTHNECFKWSVLAALHYHDVYAKNKNKTNDAKSYQRWCNELNFSGIDFPMRLNQIEKFMRQNEQIAINVYYFDLENKRVCPLFLASKSVNNRKYIHLLMHTKPSGDQSKAVHDVNVESHYSWIKNLSALVSAQLSKHGHKVSICDRCLIHFTSHHKLEKHKELCCTKMNKCSIEMPSEDDKYITFKNYKKKLKTPFIMYCDTEALLAPPESKVFSENCSTTAHHEHKVHSIGYYFKYEYEEDSESKSRYASNRGENCIEWFTNELIKIANEAYDFLRENRPMSLTEEEEKQFKEATLCHICEKEFIKDHQDIPVRDHNHQTGKFRAASHQSCNLQYQNSRTIPIVMHNMTGYDGHFLIKQIACNKNLPGEITIVPHNSENYISIIKTVHICGKKYSKQIRFMFVDSLRFLPHSLDYLASILPSEKKHILKSEYVKSGHHSDELFSLLTRKGVFPYEYVDSFEKLKETALPSKECFYSSLTDSNVSEEDYNHAQKVWTDFKVRTMGEYSDLYLKVDVLLLADIYENFRNMCYATYSLDSAQYMGSASLSWDSMLKYTGISIELFTDSNMLLYCENGVRGGISLMNKRYTKANNIYMGDEYDPSKESTYLMYYDGKAFLIFHFDFRLLIYFTYFIYSFIQSNTS